MKLGYYRAEKEQETFKVNSVLVISQKAVLPGILVFIENPEKCIISADNSSI